MIRRAAVIVIVCLVGGTAGYWLGAWWYARLADVQLEFRSWFLMVLWVIWKHQTMLLGPHLWAGIGGALGGIAAANLIRRQRKDENVDKV